MRLYQKLAFLALLLGPSLALPNGDSDDTVIPLRRPRTAAPSPLRMPNFRRSCNEEQRKTILKHMQEALLVVEAVVDSPSTSASSAAYKTFMDNSEDQVRFNAAVRIFENIKSDLAQPPKDSEDNGRPLVISCGPSEMCKGLEALAYSTMVDHTVHFCDDFFVTTVEGSWITKLKNKAVGTPNEPQFHKFACKTTQDRTNREFDYERAGINPQRIEDIYSMPATTVIHELAHLYADPGADGSQEITDCYYGAYACEYMAREMPDTALGNADNYAWFAISHYILTFCSDTEADDLIRDFQDTHNPSFQSQWTRFNENKVKYAVIQEDITQNMAKSAGPNKILNGLKIKRNSGEQLTSEEIRQLNTAKLEVERLEEARRKLNEQIKAMTLTDWKVLICDTGISTWNGVVRAMATRPHA